MINEDALTVINLIYGTGLTTKNEQPNDAEPSRLEIEVLAACKHCQLVPT